MLWEVRLHTSVNLLKLSKLGIEFVRGIMGRFSLVGMESVSQITAEIKEPELKRPGPLSGLRVTVAKLRERLAPG